MHMHKRYAIKSRGAQARFHTRRAFVRERIVAEEQTLVMRLHTWMHRTLPPRKHWIRDEHYIIMRWMLGIEPTMKDLRRNCHLSQLKAINIREYLFERGILECDHTPYIRFSLIAASNVGTVAAPLVARDVHYRS